MRRFLANSKDDMRCPATGKVAIQMNDTHPAIAGPELCDCWSTCMV